MPFQPNVVILKGRAIDRSLPQTMVHIFSQWGSLMCEQGSGRAVNRPLYEAERGELGRQWRGLSHVCHVFTLVPGLFVLMAARDWRDCGPCLRWMCVRQWRVPTRWETDLLDCIRATGAIHFQSRLLESDLLYWSDHSWQFESTSYYPVRCFSLLMSRTKWTIKLTQSWTSICFTDFTMFSSLS